MSTDCRLSEQIKASALFDGRLEALGIREHINPDETSQNKRCLTDGCNNFLWIHIDDAGLVTTLTRYAPNGDPLMILNSIANAFNTDIFTEYEPQFWGFDTEEEMEAALEKIAMQHKAKDLKFEAELLKYVRGEPNNIKEGSDAEAEAKIAKRLAEEFPALLRPENRELFRREIRRIYGVEVLDLPF
jgi:hypothetical protein